MAAIAAFAVYLALLNNFLRFERYPLLKLEVLYSVLIGAVSAAAFGILYQLSGRLPKWGRRVVRAILTAGLLGYAVVLLASFFYGALAILIGAALSFLFEERILAPIALAAFITLLVASVGIGQQKEAQFVRRGGLHRSAVFKPAIVHIILDEHIGIEGLPEANPGTARLKQVMRDFYVSRGFQLFGGTYSQFPNTQRAIPYVLNFGAQGRRYTYSSTNNSYFELLKQSGYRLNVLQSEFINYCSNLVDLCTTYQSQDYASVARSGLSAWDKTILIERRMVPTQVARAVWHTYVMLKGAGVDLPPMAPLAELNVSPLNGLDAMRLLGRDLTHLQPGQFYFAHILLPHKPYALRSDCSVAPVVQWRQGLRGQPLIERQDAYAEQMLCATRELARVLNSIDRSPAAGQTVVIVQGDHGSRISDFEPKTDNIGKFGDDTLIAWYSTLFAVRGPGIAAGYDPRHFSRVDLLEELAGSGFRSTASHPVADPTVMLADEDLTPRRLVALPKDW